MITELRAQNFKSWKDTGTLQLAPLTGFFGANSSGKTSILQVLLMLKQIVENPVDEPLDINDRISFADQLSLLKLINFGAIIHGHQKELSLDISVSWKPLEQIEIEEKLTDSLSFSTSIRNSGLNYFQYRVDDRDFEFDWTQRQQDPFEFEEVRPFQFYGVSRPDTLKIHFLPLQNAFENLFSQIRHLGPLREYPQHNYTWEGDHPDGIGQYGEKTVAALLSGRIRLLYIDEKILNTLQQLELIHSYDLHPISGSKNDYEFLVKKYKGGPEVHLTEIGFGVSQVLPVLSLCYYASEGSILILEQPEAHLHPKVQSDLADVLIDVVKNRNVQIILESHSEHLLLRLMRRIAEEEFSVNDTALYFCQINDGTSKIDRLKVDEYGNIRNWPQDFFGDSTGELIKKTKAEMQRRKVME